MRYTREHHWLRPEAGLVVVGITPFAASQLGVIEVVELPKVGQSTLQGDELAVVETSTSISDILAPITGDVVAVNPAVEGNPSLVSDDPMGEGWLMKLSVRNASEIDSMFDASGYQDLTGDVDLPA
jgi:glycine cleavage system H protein